MKNIHILPTDKPSRFVTSKENKKCYLYSIEEFKNIDKFIEYDSKSWDSQNIYITSDEEIKDVRPHKGKWQLEQGHILNKFPTYLTDLSECKLVIMTTDQDLIKDGVQAIDDEFLEWFVKNPSCEYVELKGYAIILPGESCDCDTKCDACKEEEPEYCMPEGIDSKEEHEQYLKDIGYFDIMQQYAAFCVKCDREKLPLLFAKEWYEQFNK